MATKPLYDIEALAGFLDCVSFDYFCTFTSRKQPLTLKGARVIAEKVAEKIDAPGTRSMFWAAEKNEVGNSFHFHGLIKGDLDKYHIWDWYFRKYGRVQLIDNREPDRQLAASYYCAKYVSKKIFDYDIYLSLTDRGITPPIKKLWKNQSE